MSGYKETLNLPKTDFPMKAGLATREPQMLARWEAEDLYGKIQKAREGAPLFVMHDGPPFANGDVHMGTALNKVLKDIVVKSRTMAGFRTPFVPGWDCHGLPIEFKVVKEQAGLAPAEVRRRSEEYARGYIDVQREQFRRLGVFGDWWNPYLTLDPAYEAEIVRGFAAFVEAGLVYQSRKPVHWSTGAQTALAEAEVEYLDKVSTAVTVRFELEGSEFGEGASVAIWTTTPWTLPANLAIAVHPRHKYAVAEFAGVGRLVLAEALVARTAEALGGVEARVLETFPGTRLEGLRARHPFLPRSATVYTADFVTMETGTGCVHIAPGHGNDDYVLGRQHGLDLLSPVDDRGCFTAECGVPELVGQYVFKANGTIVEMLRKGGALLAADDYPHQYPHCWRSKTPVIFRAIEQFFIRIDGLQAKALEVVEGCRWLPESTFNRIRETVRDRVDWCISRQRSWGVPVPVFYTAEGVAVLDSQVVHKVAEVFEAAGTNAWFEKSDAEWCALVGLGAGHTRKNDTLDVWIDSGMSHEAVLRRRPELAFPADLYLEATDQHRGWFQSSLMTSVALNGCAPYRAVLTHGFVVDVDTRKKISKSAQGGYTKPTTAEHFVNKHGADLVRLWVGSVIHTKPVDFSEEIFTRLSDSYRRIRNTLRILLANGGCRASGSGLPPRLTLIDRWVLDRLQEVIERCRAAYEAYDFHVVYRTLNDFCSVDLSSRYVDITKDRLYCDSTDSPRRLATVAVMREVFDALCRLLAPILVYTADEAWGYFDAGHSVHLELFPEVDESRRDGAARALMEVAMEVKAKIAQALEAAQKGGEIGSPLEARVVLGLPAGPLGEYARANHSELEELYILSDLVVVDATEVTVSVSRTPHERCERCWRHRADTGVHGAHPTLCGRCAEAVEGATHAVGALS